MATYDQVSLLITVYNRSLSLERLLKSLSEQDIVFGEIIVSDDCSKYDHVQKMKELQKVYNFNLILSEKNRGLSNNINKGQDAVTKPYTLYIQEDFVPKFSFNEKLAESIIVMENTPSIDTIRFYAYFPYPYTKSFNNSFDEMIFNPSILKWNHLKFYMYSDHPHLRRSNFCQKFGHYQEGIHSDKAEFEMCLSYIANKGRGLLVKDFSEVFDQKNSPDEPSTIGRKTWKEKNSFAIEILRKGFLIYRFIKNTYQLRKKSETILKQN